MDESGFRKYETRRITPNSVRRNPDPMPEAYRQYITEGLEIAHEPFVGITTDGTVRPNLYPIVATDHSNDALVQAANAMRARGEEVELRVSPGARQDGSQAARGKGARGSARSGHGAFRAYRLPPASPPRKG